MKKRIASMLAATVLLLSVIALPASAQTDWFGNSDLTTAKVREIADADTLTESQIAEINNHYSEYEIMQGISKTLIEDYAARINPDNPPHCAVCAGFDDLWLHYINDVYRRLGYDGSNYADLEELSNLANEAIGAQMKYPNDVNNMYRNTYNAYPLSKVWNFYTRSWS